MANAESTEQASGLRLSMPRYDQSPARSLFTDERDFSELLSVVSSSPSSENGALLDEGADDSPEVRNIDGSTRLFSAQNSLYMLPLDEQEYKRLDKQHTMLRVGLLGLYPAREVVSTILNSSGLTQRAVLDIGCGTGQWAQELSASYPGIKIVALDQIQIESTLPDNVEFHKHNVNDGLESYYGQFDVVHCRFIASGIMRYRELVDEVRRCLRPGGMAIFIEGDFDLFDEDRKAIEEPASDENPDGCWLARWLNAVRMAQVKRGKCYSTDECPETLDKGLWQFGVFDPVSCGVGSLFTPTSPWINSTMEEEALHFKIAGVLNRQRLKLLILSTEQLLIEDGLSQEEVDLWMTKIKEEMEDETRYKTWNHWRMAWGRLPGGPMPSTSATTISAPPPMPLPGAPTTNQTNLLHPTQPNLHSATQDRFVPKTITSVRNLEARRKLINKLEEFRIQQCYIYRTEREAEVAIRWREGLKWNTRGVFQ